MAFLAAGRRVEFVPIQVIPQASSQSHSSGGRHVALVAMVAEIRPAHDMGKPAKPVIQAILPAARTEMLRWENARRLNWSDYRRISRWHPHSQTGRRILTRAKPLVNHAASSNCGLITSLPLASTKPQRPDWRTGASPSENAAASSNCGLITNFRRDYKPQRLPSRAGARPLTKLPASSNCGLMTNFPVLSTKPHLPPDRTAARPSENACARSNCGLMASLPSLSV